MKPGKWFRTGWTPEQLALLGTAPDAQLAKRLGRSPEAVRAKRCLRRVPLFSATAENSQRAWAEEDLALVGTDRDEVIARKIGRTAKAVGDKRRARGIAHSGVHSGNRHRPRLAGVVLRGPK
ncbi:MAG TPA: hypothetical protein VKE74_19755 [Gemmataceae bacterium]|nr:hypothetical protein [Gemmataceae bacterium]